MARHMAFDGLRRPFDAQIRHFRSDSLVARFRRRETSTKMAINIGLDIGAISLELAALGAPADRPALEALCAANPDFRMSALDGRPLVLSNYRRISGSPIQSAYDVLREFYAAVPEQ